MLKHVVPNIMNFTCELNYMSHRLYALFKMKGLPISSQAVRVYNALLSPSAARR